MVMTIGLAQRCIVASVAMRCVFVASHVFAGPPPWSISGLFQNIGVNVQAYY